MLPLQQRLAKLQAGVEVLAPGFDLRPDALVILHEQFHRGDVPGGGGRQEDGAGERVGEEKSGVTGQPDAKSCSEGPAAWGLSPPPAGTLVLTDALVSPTGQWPGHGGPAGTSEEAWGMPFDKKKK